MNRCQLSWTWTRVTQRWPFGCQDHLVKTVVMVSWFQLFFFSDGLPSHPFFEHSASCVIGLYFLCDSLKWHDGNSRHSGAESRQRTLKGPHYFNSLTPDQNNKDFFFHQGYTTCRLVCSDVCRRTRIQCCADESPSANCLLSLSVLQLLCLLVFDFLDPLRLIIFFSQICKWYVKSGNGVSRFATAHKRMSTKATKGHFIFALLLLGNVKRSSPRKRLIRWRESAFKPPVFVLPLNWWLSAQYKFFRDPNGEKLVLLHFQCEVRVSLPKRDETSEMIPCSLI